MPANNRVHSSAALQTHGIWQSAIGYDPYAPDQKQAPPAAASADRDAQASLSAPSTDQQNTYDSFQGLLALARLTGSNADEARGACRKCGRVGHLPFQCRNFLKDEAALVATAAAANVSSHLDGGFSFSHRKGRIHDKSSRKSQGASGSASDEDELSDTDDSGLSDSSADSEMERAIATKFGKDVLKSLCKKSKSSHSKDRSSHKRSHSKRSKSKKEDDSDEKHERKGKHSSRSKRSRSDASDLGSDESGDDERRSKRRRHSHKHGRSSSKHHSKHSDESSERSRGRHTKKRKSSRKQRRDSKSD